MERVSTDLSKRAEIIALANSMLNDEINLIEGARKLCALRFVSGDPENEVFMPIRAVESETDHFPFGELRSRFAPDYLQRLDIEMDNYIKSAREDILNACREILRVYS